MSLWRFCCVQPKRTRDVTATERSSGIRDHSNCATMSEERMKRASANSPCNSSETTTDNDKKESIERAVGSKNTSKKKRLRAVDVEDFDYHDDSKTEGELLIQIEVTKKAARFGRYWPSEVTIGHLPWQLMANVQTSKVAGNVEYLCVFVYCNQRSLSTLWSCNADIKLKLCCKNQKAADCTCQDSMEFNYDKKKYGPIYFVEYNKLMKMVGVNKIVGIKVEIAIKKITGFRCPLLPLDVTVPGRHFDDVVLLIGNGRVYVNKYYLSIYSPVFAAMFFGAFRESHTNEVRIEDVKLDEFIEFLRVIYPPHAPVRRENVEFLLELGDRFDVQFVMDVCEKFLLQAKYIVVDTKLIWADWYQLSSLQDTCLRTFRTYEELLPVLSYMEYKNVSYASKKAVSERAAILCEDVRYRPRFTQDESPART